jgi:formylglycine-generating enzyme required for sulfatase activity
MKRRLRLALALALIAGTAQGAEEFRECPSCPQMVAVPGGKFLMGSPVAEPGRFDSEGPPHVVSLKAFALGKYPVTSEEFLTFLRGTGYQPAPCNALLGLGWRQGPRGLAYPPSQNEPPRWPAVCLDHADALAYVAWLNKEAKAAHPTLAGAPYRLPSEAEWEYAARAGTNTARWWGDAIGRGNANCNGCGSVFDNRVLGDVDAFGVNGFGLAGMLGNAWEWTADCWHPSYVGAPVDGSAWSAPACKKFVLRGGAWNNVPIFIRSAARSAGSDDFGSQDYDYSSLAGFRVARSLP